MINQLAESAKSGTKQQKYQVMTFLNIFLTPHASLLPSPQLRKLHSNPYLDPQ